MKREILRLERKYRKQQTDFISLEMFKDKCRVYKHLLHCAKRAYYQGKFENCDTDKSLSIS